MKGILKLAVLGMVAGNGHPYSWSAIFNGYDPLEMAKSPYPGILDYLAKQPEHTLQIPGAQVTHIWTDQIEDARKVAKAAYIPIIAAKPEDVIGCVDAVLITTDIGFEHVERCRPFVDAGVPIFVDKPLVDNEADLAVFRKWINAGAVIMSSSCMRYCKEFMPYRMSTHNLGELRYCSITTLNLWEKYGIHALEAIYPILGPGFVSVRNTGTLNRNIVHCKHINGADIIVAAIKDMYGGFGVLQLIGTKSHELAVFKDTFFAFKAQLADFIRYLQTGNRPFPFAETEELMKLVIAGIQSREQGGREVFLAEIS